MLIKLSRIVIIASVLLSLMNHPSLSEERHFFFENGNVFKDQCIDTQEYFTACISYVRGISDGMSAIKGLTYFTANANMKDTKDANHPLPAHDVNKEGPAPCYPVGGVRNDQLFDVLKNYIVNHPEDRNASVEIIAAIAWAQAWPCDKQPLIFPENCPTPVASPPPVCPQETCMGSLCMRIK